MTADTGDLPYGAHVPLEAGLWAVALVVLVVLILLTALRPVLRRRSKEDPVPCCVPGSLGSHPLLDPDGDGVRSCACGAVRRLPLVARTDTREHRWPTAEQPAVHTIADAPTDEQPLPHVVWSRP